VEVDTLARVRDLHERYFARLTPLAEVAEVAEVADVGDGDGAAAGRAAVDATDQGVQAPSGKPGVAPTSDAEVKAPGEARPVRRRGPRREQQ
jgi:hypothetical protein